MPRPLKILLLVLGISILSLVLWFAMRVIFTKNTQNPTAGNSVTVPADNVAKFHDQIRQADVEKLQISLSAYYYIQNPSHYPASLADLITAGEIAKIPLDPFTNQPYKYTLGANGQTYQICVNFETKPAACFTPDSRPQN